MSLVIVQGGGMYDAEEEDELALKFDITFPFPDLQGGSEEWANLAAASQAWFIFDKADYSGYTSIIFRSLIGQTNPEDDGTVWLRLVTKAHPADSDGTPIAGSEMSFSGPVVVTAEELFETDDLSDALPEGQLILQTQGKVTDADNTYGDWNCTALVVRFG